MTNQDMQVVDSVDDLFYTNLHPEHIDEYHHKFTKISEIAVKALSPAINDPGTAKIALHFLSILFELAMKLPEYLTFNVKESEAVLTVQLPGLNHLITSGITPIRQYVGNSTEVFSTLFTFFELLLRKAAIHQYPLIVSHLHALIATAERSIKNTYDRNTLNLQIENIGKLPALSAETLLHLN